MAQVDAGIRIEVDRAEMTGSLELWRHALGHGGVNPLPLPSRVVAGTAHLQPRRIRVFLQEFFRIYPERDRFDWSRLDPYMDALAATGAEVVAAICIKPPPLFPGIDPAVWRPTDAAAWQRVIGALVTRYGVERRLITHWEVGNEVDIGEDGGCPYLIRDPADYHEHYTMTIAAILAADPQAKVGGPANAGVHNEPMPGFLRLCREQGTRLDFISHHLYSDDPERHAAGVRQARAWVADFDHDVETVVSEFSPTIRHAQTPRQVLDPRRAAATAAAALAMGAAGLSWSYNYHLWDQVCRPEDFEPFFTPKGVANMTRHWNEVPHRFGLFGAEGDVRPQYFLYWMLSQMGDTRLAVRRPDDVEVNAAETGISGVSGACDAGDGLRIVAAASGTGARTLLVNYQPEAETERTVTLQWTNMAPGMKRVSVYRIDAARRWSGLHPVAMEVRETPDPEGRHEHRLCLPAGSVALVCLDESKVRA